MRTKILNSKLTERQENILKYIIETYIHTSEPVGSKFLNQKLLQKISSATIRNDLAKLENLGYLKKNYASSGRSPTKEGYKFYVKQLMHKFNYQEDITPLLVPIERILDHRHDNIDYTVNDTVKFLTQCLDLPIVVSKIPNEAELLRKIDIVNIDQTNFMIYLITSASHVIKCFVQIANPTQAKDIEACMRIFNENITNVPLKAVRAKINELTDLIQDRVHEFEFIFQRVILKMVEELETKHTQIETKVYNTKALVNQPEIKNADIQIADILEFLENQSIFQQIHYNYLKTGNTLIQFNNHLPGISVAATEINDKGTYHQISVVGPLRMNYKLVTKILEFIYEKLSTKS